MKASIIFYKLDEHLPKKKEKVLTQLWGKKQKSYYGKYSYDVDGILDKIPHIKPARTAIIVRQKDKKKVTSFLDKHGVLYATFETNIDKELFSSKGIYH